MSRLVDVAGRAHVSLATTSRVLNGTGFVSDALRQRVLAAVKELNYTPDGIARSMAKGQTLTLGLVVADITSSFFNQVARGVEDMGRAHGYSVVLCNADEDLSKEQAYLAMLREKRVDGILLAPSSGEVAHVQRLADAGVTLALLDRGIPALEIPSVQVDNVGGMYRATEYLLGLGHRRIAMVVGDLAITTAHQRLEGFTAALEAARVPLNPDLLIPARPHQDGGFDAARQIWNLRPRPTAIISWGDVTTTGVLLALRDCGAHIPEDISVIGFDDVPLFTLLARPLTVIAQPAYEVGQRACALLLRMIRDEAPLPPEESQIILPTQFLIRASCGWAARRDLRTRETERHMESLVVAPVTGQQRHGEAGQDPTAGACPPRPRGAPLTVTASEKTRKGERCHAN
jgi:LacI family transcriptional regulator